ncbi:oxidoreductase [Tomitella gaofuii]|uniref:oxidoreductase n=1 Tax=Tomitella gaofuii TaxID=2760083 RepID=UPI0015FCCD99|nr:oxidoreductase [Tomitella gaofuii]
MTTSRHSAPDPLAPLAALPGVADAADRARAALEEAHRHKANRRGWPTSATEASLRAARNSAALDGASIALPEDGDITDPLLAGALRVSAMLDGDALTNTLGTWERAPLQVIARLHTVAAAGVVDDPDALGRPRATPGISERLDALAELATGGTSVAAPLLAAVVHGELLTLRPFGTADGIVARAASRLTCTATGLDPHNLGVPEAYWLKRRNAYRQAADGYAAGTAEGVAGWIITCCAALETGGHEAVKIAEAHSG